MDNPSVALFCPYAFLTGILNFAAKKVMNTKKRQPDMSQWIYVAARHVGNV